MEAPGGTGIVKTALQDRQRVQTRQLVQALGNTQVPAGIANPTAAVRVYITLR